MVTIPLHEGSFPAPLAGFEYLPADPGWWALWKEPSGEKVDLDRWLGSTIARQPFVTAPLRVVHDLAQEEYAFLARNAQARTKFTVPAPSFHRIFWHEDHSRDAYPTSDDFIAAVADYLRTELVPSLRALGCDYIQMDAPNYAQWHIDPDNRAAYEAAGHDAAHELDADVEFDNSVFDGVDDITRAIHICRGNAPDGRFLASGGYETISRQVFPRLTNYDTLLLEYDTERSGGFEPLNDVLEHHTVVLGLVTTKSPTARGRRGGRGPSAPGVSLRSSRSTGAQPPVRLRLGRRSPHHDPRRTRGQAAPHRSRRPQDLERLTTGPRTSTRGVVDDADVPVHLVAVTVMSNSTNARHASRRSPTRCGSDSVGHSVPPADRHVRQHRARGAGHRVAHADRSAVGPEPASQGDERGVVACR